MQVVQTFGHVLRYDLINVGMYSRALAQPGGRLKGPFPPIFESA